MGYSKYCEETIGFFDYCYYDESHRTDWILTGKTYYKGKETQTSNKCVTTGGNGYCCTHSNVIKNPFTSSCGVTGINVLYK
ncbi:hypothetical protein [Aliarcobacter butzleri]|uniref:hypothetical protein n=1 Tax=Aliarcobacter butzleri TaxID=28197 RepID=UPI001269C42A|nr:hypothetical protein [Aliarcobacter butzleri]